MFRLEWLFLMQLALGILMIIFLQKLTQMKKQVDEITREVASYISYITEEMEEDEKKNLSSEQKKNYEEEITPGELARKEKEEAQNHLIQAVLGEYFP